MARAMLEHATRPDVAAAQSRAIAVGWAGRGAWDSALVAAERYAAAGSNAAAELFGYELAAVGAWLGGVDPTAAQRWQVRHRRIADQVEQADRAEAAWLDGLLAASRGDRNGIGAARRNARATGAPFADLLDQTLEAYERDLAGDGGGAAAALSAVEAAIVQRGIQAFGRDYPYVSAVNRILLGRRLRESGRLAEAERALRWYQVVYPGRFYRVAFANRSMASVAYYERARVAAAAGDSGQATEFYERFLSGYDRPVPAFAEMVDRAREFVRNAR
jgi:hypothetical protein